ncbi:hypothetical protein PC113_g16396 [Phytophthora cactorum]|uniref:Uncharacterized protein n=2 Tax=Phytophthora cactorum TaxID=29920 RepID=A0A8T0YL14_9STRA|nr:hypothetical protein PC112_g19155 [Phytophthora cactorum]KAG2804429.1 hypothetical protein PC111_g18260 [Phytophthora cactorum]KAG2850876.1 hypothetical protein PC113_g16396 [Phytophthora cactorum]
MPRSIPWGVMENAVVKFKVKKLHELPPRPRNCIDDQWGLVERMCKYDPCARIEIIAVVDELGKFAQVSEETTVCDERAVDAVSEQEGVKSIVAAMKQLTIDSDSDASYKAKLARIYRQLWSRIGQAVPFSKPEDNTLWRDAEFLAIVDDAFGSTKRALENQRGTLISYTEDPKLTI